MARLDNNPKLFTCNRQEDEAIVQNGLALTPSQMYEMMQQGKAVTTSNLNESMFNDGVPNPGEVPFEQKRGVEVTDIWEHSMAARKKINKAITEHKKNMSINQGSTL